MKSKGKRGTNKDTWTLTPKEVGGELCMRLRNRCNAMQLIFSFSLLSYIFSDCVVFLTTSYATKLTRLKREDASMITKVHVHACPRTVTPFINIDSRSCMDLGCHGYFLQLEVLWGVVGDKVGLLTRRVLDWIKKAWRRWYKQFQPSLLWLKLDGYLGWTRDIWKPKASSGWREYAGIHHFVQQLGHLVMS